MVSISSIIIMQTEICKHVFFPLLLRHIVRYSLFMSSDQKKKGNLSGNIIENFNEIKNSIKLIFLHS